MTECARWINVFVGCLCVMCRSIYCCWIILWWLRFDFIRLMEYFASFFFFFLALLSFTNVQGKWEAVSGGLELRSQIMFEFMSRNVNQQKGNRSKCESLLDVYKPLIAMILMLLYVNSHWYYFPIPTAHQNLSHSAPWFFFFLCVHKYICMKGYWGIE